MVVCITITWPRKIKEMLVCITMNGRWGQIQYKDHLLSVKGFRVGFSIYRCNLTSIGISMLKMFSQPSYVYNGKHKTWKDGLQIKTISAFRGKFDIFILAQWKLYLKHIFFKSHWMWRKYFVWVSKINSLWPSETIWWLRSQSTLAQVMSCCLTMPSHYLNQW